MPPPSRLDLAALLDGEGPMVDNPSVLGTGSHRVSSCCGRSARICTNSPDWMVVVRG